MGVVFASRSALPPCRPSRWQASALLRCRPFLVLSPPVCRCVAVAPSLLLDHHNSLVALEALGPMAAASLPLVLAPAGLAAAIGAGWARGWHPASFSIFDSLQRSRAVSVPLLVSVPCSSGSW